MSTTKVEDQPPPVPNARPAIVDLVIADLLERKRIGTERYGTPLQAHNGRGALVDLYQELQDATFYVRQVIEERNGRCSWTEDADGFYATACGQAHVFTTGTPAENEYRFCPYCGRAQETVAHEPERPDWLEGKEG